MIKYLPNALTILRIVLTPVFIALTFYFTSTSAILWALLVFVVAAITDWLDGMIARKHNIISNFGKIWDPLADKFIVISALAALTWKSPFNLHLAIFVIILFREIAVTIMREIYVRKHIIIAADKWGKLKTVLQMVGIILCLSFWAGGFYPANLISASQVWFWIVAVITVMSGLNYLRIKR